MGTSMLWLVWELAGAMEPGFIMHSTDGFGYINGAGRGHQNGWGGGFLTYHRLYFRFT